jgi:hypothetical protein
LFLGSDGVFDRVNESFPREVLRGAIRQNGDLQAVCEQVVRELAEYRDEDGYVFDDNVTLGLMGEGRSPRVSRGFWQEESGDPAAPGPECADAAGAGEFDADREVSTWCFDPIPGAESKLAT